MKRRSRHTTNAISRKSLLTSTRSFEGVEQNTRTESVGRGEKAEFGGWDGGGGGAEKRGN